MPIYQNKKMSDVAIDDMMQEYALKENDSYIYKYFLEFDSNIQKRKLENITSEELKKAIDKRIKTFKYDLQTRSNNTAINLINGWYQMHDRKIQETGVNEISTEKYQTLYDKLYKSPASDKVLIPIKVDAKSGIGLFIIGRDNYLKNEFLYPATYHCGIDIISNWENTDDYGVCLYRIGRHDSSSDNYLSDIKNVRDASLWFDKWLSINEDDVLSEIRNLNGNMPEGCPEELMKYFADYFPDEDDYWSISDDDRDRIMSEF